MYSHNWGPQRTPSCVLWWHHWQSQSCLCQGQSAPPPAQTYHVDIDQLCVFTFYNCIVPMGFLQKEIQVAFPRESQLRQPRYPTYGACWVFQRFYNPPNSDKDYRIFNMRTDVNAWDCTRGCMDTVRESVQKADLGRKIPSRCGKLNLRQRHAGPLFYQLSYIPWLIRVLLCDTSELSWHCHSALPD